jgi:voltage-gated potassium channel
LIFVLRFLFGTIQSPPAPFRVSALLLAVTAYGTAGYVYFERPMKPELTWLDGLWWSLVTLTTVGYGDLYPASTGGRFLVAAPMMLGGIGLLGYALSLTASSLVESKNREVQGMSSFQMTGHLLLINFPNLAKVERVLAELLHPRGLGRGIDIVLIDEELAQLPAELVGRVRFVRGDPSRDETLTRASLDGAKQAVILSKRPGDPHSDHQSLAVTLAIEARKHSVRTIVECVNLSTEELLRKAGCDSVVCTSRFDAHFIGTEVLTPGAHEVVDELMSSVRGQQIYMTPFVPRKGATFGDALAACQRRGHIAIGVRHEGHTKLNVERGYQLSQGDEIVTIGPSALGSFDGAD